MRHLVVTALAAIAMLVAVPGRADAYPQFQLAIDQRCISCHLSPAGGGQLSENGLAVAESISQLGHAPEFFYNKLGTPSWLVLGGDLRGSAGFLATPEKALAAFPMQSELYASVQVSNFTVHGTVGGRPARYGDEATTRVWSREHYLMWKQNPGEAAGVVVRAGRFMPVFGLRFAEHPMYVKRYGGTPLFAETYGVHGAYFAPSFEVHATAFVADPVITPVNHSTGGALYGEYSLDEATILGGEFMYAQTADDKRARYGVIAKRYIEPAGLLLQTEIQFVNQIIDRTPTNPDGGAPLQLVGNLVASKMLGTFLMLDVGLGHFDSNVRIKHIDRDSIDINLHYFLTSHVELAWNTRFEMFGFGNGGPSSGYSLLQLHYRL